jgi:hypothetical protein
LPACARTLTRTHARTHTCTRMHARTRTHERARTHAHARTHARTHAHARARTHAQRRRTTGVIRHSCALQLSDLRFLCENIARIRKFWTLLEAFELFEGLSPPVFAGLVKNGQTDWSKKGQTDRSNTLVKEGSKIGQTDWSKKGQRSVKRTGQRSVKDRSNGRVKEGSKIGQTNGSKKGQRSVKRTGQRRVKSLCAPDGRTRARHTKPPAPRPRHLDQRSSTPMADAETPTLQTRPSNRSAPPTAAPLRG